MTMNANLSRLSTELVRSKGYLVRKAIESYLSDKMDLLITLNRIENNEEEVDFSEIEKNMTWKIKFKTSAEKEFEKLPNNAKRDIRDYLLSKVVQNPREYGKAMQGNDTIKPWRYRAKDCIQRY